MKIATLTRSLRSPEFTLGTFSFLSLSCFSLELPWRENQRGISCIPEGVYTVKWEKSPTKGWCYHILNVPGRAGVLIHSANLTSQLRGCIALGKTTGLIDGKVAVLASRPCISIFEHLGAQETITLEIK